MKTDKLEKIINSSFEKKENINQKSDKKIYSNLLKYWGKF